MTISTTITYFLSCDNMPYKGCPQYFRGETKEELIKDANNSGWLINGSIQLCPLCKKEYKGEK